MSPDELKLAGLESRNPKGILDSEEKVRSLEEELTKALEAASKQWESVKRDSQEQANRCFLS